jgi:hypothetical protein
MNAVVVVILILMFIFVVMPLLAFMFTVTVVSGTVRGVGKDITKSVKDHKETESKKKFPLSLAGYKSRQGKLPAPGIPARRVGSGGTRYRDYSCTNDQECAAIAFSKDGYSTHGYNKAQACKILEEGNLIDAPKPMEEGTLFKDTLNCAPFDAEEVASSAEEKAAQIAALGATMAKCGPNSSKSCGMMDPVRRAAAKGQLDQLGEA